MPGAVFEKKVLLIGDPAVGKTSLVRRFVVDYFDDRYLQTIGVKPMRKAIMLKARPDGPTLQLNLTLWDILGQKGVERTHKMYFQGASAFILVVDGTRRDTLESVGYWMDRVHEFCGAVPGAVVCNKSDLTLQFAFSADDVRAVARAHRLAAGWTSAKTGAGVEDMFRGVGQMLVGERGAGSSVTPSGAT